MLCVFTDPAKQQTKEGRGYSIILMSERGREEEREERGGRKTEKRVVEVVVWQSRANTPPTPRRIYTHTLSVSAHTPPRAATLISANKTHCWMELKHQLKAPLSHAVFLPFTPNVPRPLSLSQSA